MLIVLIVGEGILLWTFIKVNKCYNKMINII